MQVQVSNVAEQIVTKKLTRKERQIKKIKEAFKKENRIVWDNIDENTAALCKAMKAYVEANPRLMGDNAEDADDKYFEFIAQQQYKALRKAKLVQPKKPKEAKIVKQKQAKVVQQKQEKAVEPKRVKVAKPKVVKEVKPPTPPKPSRAEKAYNQLYEQFSALTDQELAAQFVLNQNTWLMEPKTEFWCTICEKKFDKLYGLNRHFKKHMTSAPKTPEELTSSERSVSPSEQSAFTESLSQSEDFTFTESSLSPTDESYSSDSPLSPEDFMSISFSEDSDEA